mgnify:CR=1 FL=1
MEQKLTGRRMVVTGAASGIGRAIATLFAEHGAKLALLDRHWPDGVRFTGSEAFGCVICDPAAVDGQDRPVSALVWSLASASVVQSSSPAVRISTNM